MEQNPFDNSSESGDNDWEVSPEDLEGAEDESEEKEEKPKRSLFESVKDREEREAEEAEEKKSLFEKLLSGDEEKDQDDGGETPTEENVFLNPPAELEEPLVETTPATSEEVAQEFEQVTQDRIEELDDEIVHESEPTKVGELLADASLLENVVDKIEEGQDPVNAIENATEETLENPIPDAGLEEVVAEVEPVSVDAPGEIDTTPPVVETEPEDETPIAPPNPPVPMQPVSPNPLPTAAELNAYSSSPASESTPQQQNDELEPMNDSYNRDPNTGKVIAAGVLGYALGRRGGRKRTEEKLQPVIDNQERTIDDLSGQLEASEEAVRKAAAEQAAMQPIDVELPVVETRQAEEIATHAETMQDERLEFEERERQFEQQLSEEESAREEAERVTAEAIQSEQEELEVLKNVRENEISVQQESEEVISLQNRAETEEEKRQEKAKAAAQIEQKAKEKARLQDAKREIDASQLPLAKVLEVAEFIPMKGDMNLRQLFEAKRIDAVNIRRIVNEYNRGGNYEKVLDKSLEAVEMRSELKHEVKQDNSIYKQPEKAAHSLVDGLIAATGGDPNNVLGESSASATAPASSAGTDSPVVLTSEEPGLIISNGTAIVLGIVAGIVIMILILLYSGVF